MVTAVEEAIALATRKYYKTQENMRAELNKETGEIRAYVYKTVSATDDEIEDDREPDHAGRGKGAGARSGSGRRDSLLQATPTSLGRIAAQMAKQVIFQKVREAERDTVFNEYAHREGEVLNATVKRIEGAGRDLRPGQGGSALPQARADRGWSSSASASACAWFC